LIGTINRLWIIVQIAAPAIRHFVMHSRGYSQIPNFRFGSVADADAKNEKQVGTDNGFCLRTVAGEAYECNWTAFLADGQITAEGPFYDAKDSILTVTGGTGAYDGMHGQLKLHARDAKGSEYDFVYEISK
jgi:hypothetical protein